ncbi:MAG: DUF1036 domain-containing protein [Hyphomicrobiales bacterium]
MRSFTMGTKSKLYDFDSNGENAKRLSQHAGHNSGLSKLMSSLFSHAAKAGLTIALAACFFGGLSFVNDDQAHADLRICNKSESRVGISIGYRSDRGWTTEGWWNLEPTSCEVILPGDLKSQYYYMFAVDYDEGGEWAGSAYMCTADKIYTIHGIEDCLARGFQRTGFFEIDTGTQTSWTIQLTEPTQRGTGGK